MFVSKSQLGKKLLVLSDLEYLKLCPIDYIDNIQYKIIK